MVSEPGLRTPHFAGSGGDEKESRISFLLDPPLCDAAADHCVILLISPFRPPDMCLRLSLRAYQGLSVPAPCMLCRVDGASNTHTALLLSSVTAGPLLSI
jgi:hypothetical protein